MERLRKAVIAVAVVVGAALMAGYENGPAPQAGGGVDRAQDEDGVFAKGLIGEGRANVDRAVEGSPR